MHEVERYQHQLHAQLPSFKRKVARAQSIITEAVQCISSPYVAFSGGVDSQVVLDILYASGYHGSVLWGDDGADFPETLQFLRETEARYGFTLKHIRSLGSWQDWCHEMGRPDLAVDPDRAWLNPRAWDETWHLLNDAVHHGYRGVFLGLLASESRVRRMQLKGGTKPLYPVKSEQGMWHCSPLASWDKRDVWAYVVSRELAYNPVYDRLAELGVPLSHRRVAPLTCFRVMQYGSHAVLKQGWPDLYNHLTRTFPSVREYA